MKSKKQFICAIISSFLIGAIVFSVLTFAIVKNTEVASFLSELLMSSDSETSKFSSVYYDIVNSHLYEQDKEKLINDAIDGMLNGIDDPYTFFRDASEYAVMENTKNPSYVGIGITVSYVLSEDSLVITEINPQSNALEVGIEVNDEIIGVNGIDCTANNRSELVASIAGEKGTTVHLTIRRNGENLEFDVERREFKISLVLSTIFNDTVGYIRIVSFQSSVLNDFKDALEKLRESGITSLIIDLRENGGGLKDVSVKLADIFVDEGIICSTSTRAGITHVDYATKGSVDIPLAVLVDCNSASASELFSGAIQDNGVGILVGTTTFGKGIFQYTKVLSDKTYYQFTAGEWLTPNGNCIHGIGLTPDVYIEADEEFRNYFRSNTTSVTKPENDTQLAKAIEVLLAENAE